MNIIKAYITIWAVFLGTGYLVLQANWPETSAVRSTELARKLPNVTKAQCGDWVDGLADCYVHYDGAYKSNHIVVEQP